MGRLALLISDNFTSYVLSYQRAPGAIEYTCKNALNAATTRGCSIANYLVKKPDTYLSGRFLPIKDMEVNHLVNVMSLL